MGSLRIAASPSLALADSAKPTAIGDPERTGAVVQARGNDWSRIDPGGHCAQREVPSAYLGAGQ